MATRVGAYEFDDDPDRIDLEAAWQFLSENAYWSRWRSREEFQQQVANAWRVVACYDEDGNTVGFVRSFSDGVATAYLADLFVLSEHRGRGLGVALIDEMVDRGPGRDFRWMLHTADAHGLYKKFDFTEPDEKYMERPRRCPA